MPQIKYIFGDLGSQQVIAELPMSSVSMDRKLNGWGTLTGTLFLDRAGIDNADVIASTIPGRCFIIVERDNTPVWDGIIWTRSYDNQGKDLNITGRGYEGYPERQLILESISYDLVEQRNIMRDLWNRMQSDPTRNIGIAIPASFTTLKPRSLTIDANEYKNFLQVMSSIADGDDGFDWTIVTTKQNNQYIRTLKIGYPFLGTTSGAALSFDYPGAITNYWKTDVINNAGTNAYVLCAGEGSSMVVGVAIQQDLLDSGFKRFDFTVSRKDIDDPTNAQSLANQLGAQRRPPLSVLKCVLKADIEPVFGSYGLGDTATLSIVDARHPAGLTTTARIIAFSYVPQSDESIDKVELVFEGDQLNS